MLKGACPGCFYAMKAQTHSWQGSFCWPGSLSQRHFEMLSLTSCLHFQGGDSHSFHCRLP